MKETSFIKQNKEKWEKFEKLYESQSHDPEELSDLYMDITEDLSYAQTFYKRRTVRVYLNGLAQRVYTGVHKQKSDSSGKLWTVWTKSLPLEIYRSRKNLLFALITFLIYAATGAFNTHIEPNFLSSVVGEGYVQRTLNNIANGNPLAVYQQDDQLGMFLNITTNNLKVAFLTFFAGFFLTLGTHLLLFYNGVMLGSFQYFFHTKGLLITSFLGIWIHGAFEISAIVLAGGAGITAGNGLLFPHSYTRLQSLQLSTKRGLKIMMSLIPFIIMAGFLESFVTANYQELPDWSKWILILFSFSLILFYYVLYPIYVARKHPELIANEEVVNVKPRKKFSYYQIRNIGEIFTDSTRIYRAYFANFMKAISWTALPLALSLVAYQGYNHYDQQQTEYWFDWVSQLEMMLGYSFNNLGDYVVIFGWTLVFTLIYVSVYWAMDAQEKAFSWNSFWSFTRKKFLGVWLANLTLTIIVFTSNWGWMFFWLLLIPFVLLNPAVAALDKGPFRKLWSKGFFVSTKHWGKSIVLLIILIIITFIAMQPIAFIFSIHEGWNDEPLVRDLLDMITGFIKRVTQIYTDDFIFPANIVRQLFYLVYIFFLMPLLVVITGLGFYNVREAEEATGLRKEFELFGRRSRLRETETDFE